MSKAELDYVRRTMKLHLDVLVGSPDAPTEPDRAAIPNDAFGIRGFVQQWKSSINVVARDASLVWHEEAT